MPVCPICNNELQDGETLSLEYYAPKNWWVFYHNRKESESTEPDLRNPDDGPWTITRNKGWCARANVVIDHPIPFQLRGTDWISF